MTDLLRPEDLRKISDDEDMAKAKKALEQMKAEEAEQASLREIFMHRDIHPEATTRINAAIRRAAQQGQRQFMALKFPASYCNDQGRRINNMEPDWPESLEGFAKKAYDFYMKELKPLGFRLSAQIMDYPGGMPGNVGIYLHWDA
ncbi:MAG: hypothetical protein R3D05_22290 [Dongiaceae bacterium]